METPEKLTNTLSELAVTNTVPNTFESLFWGYSILWLLILFFVWRMFRKVSELEKEISNNKKS